MPYRGQPSLVYRCRSRSDLARSRDRHRRVRRLRRSRRRRRHIRPPDATITTDTPGSGASRLQLVVRRQRHVRVRVTSTPELDDVAAGAGRDSRSRRVTSTIGEARVHRARRRRRDRQGRSGYEVRVPRRLRRSPPTTSTTRMAVDRDGRRRSTPARCRCSTSSGLLARDRLLRRHPRVRQLLQHERARDRRSSRRTTARSARSMRASSRPRRTAR